MHLGYLCSIYNMDPLINNESAPHSHWGPFHNPCLTTRHLHRGVNHARRQPAWPGLSLGFSDRSPKNTSTLRIGWAEDRTCTSPLRPHSDQLFKSPLLTSVLFYADGRWMPAHRNNVLSFKDAVTQNWRNCFALNGNGLGDVPIEEAVVEFQRRNCGRKIHSRTLKV